MTLAEFIKANGIVFAKKRVQENPRLAGLGFNPTQYFMHFRVGLKRADKVALFFVSAMYHDEKKVSDEAVLRALALEAREARIPVGEFEYATGRSGAAVKDSRLQKRVDSLKSLLGPEAYAQLTEKVILT